MYLLIRKDKLKLNLFKKTLILQNINYVFKLILFLLIQE